MRAIRDSHADRPTVAIVVDAKVAGVEPHRSKVRGVRVSLEQFSAVISSIHTAAAFPERWPEAVSAVVRLVNPSQEKGNGATGWENVLAFDQLDDERQMQRISEPSVRRLLTLLAPHLKTAKQVQTKLAEGLVGRLALASLDRLAVAAFIVNNVGAVHHLNASARTLLEEDRFARIGESGLRFSQPAVNGAFEEALRKATNAPARSSLLPLSSRAKEIFEVTVSPLEPDPTRLASCPVSLALVVIARPHPDKKRIADRVRRLYGLTEAEARVVAAVTSGETVEDIAREHGVRASTVRAQVRSIFEKTGVNRQCDLVRLALTGAPLVSGPDD